MAINEKLGISDRKIALEFGIAEATFNNWKKSRKKLIEVLAKAYFTNLHKIDNEYSLNEIRVFISKKEKKENSQK